MAELTPFLNENQNLIFENMHSRNHGPFYDADCESVLGIQLHELHTVSKEVKLISHALFLTRSHRPLNKSKHFLLHGFSFICLKLS